MATSQFPPLDKAAAKPTSPSKISRAPVIPLAADFAAVTPIEAA